MKIKAILITLLLATATPMQAQKSLDEYSLRTKQAGLHILKNPELRKKLLAPKQEKTWWQTFTGWFGF
jgi:hypothetical protein